MFRRVSLSHAVLSVLLVAGSLAHAAGLELQSVTFPEKQPVDLPVVTRPIAPSAKLDASAVHKQGQTRIELSYSAMKPAILFGGDITCYVVWAVTRDGAAENLGELTTRKPSGKLTFHTGKKQFALVVTAEAYYLVGRPSELVVFKNVAPLNKPGLSAAFSFDGFAPAPRHNMDAISHLKWDSDVPLELLQARKAYELATRYEAPVHAAEIHAEADVALQAANGLARGSARSREMLDAARRAVALSNEAINISIHRIEAIEIEQAVARRREETAALERRAAEAEAAAQEAQRLAAQVRQEAETVRAEKERMLGETVALRSEKSSLESAMLLLREQKMDHQMLAQRLHQEKTLLEADALRLRQETALLTRDKQALAQQAERLEREKLELETRAEKLRLEKAALSGRLENALSHVAETTGSARGLVVNLPDILFDVNEATLRTDAQMVLAKLAGILLILPDQKVRVEGHTDSTGSPEYNLDLSQRRADAVLTLLRAQGLDPGRLHAVGFGVGKPVADNATPEGRKRNRRVEIIISDESQTMASN